MSAEAVVDGWRGRADAGWEYRVICSVSGKWWWGSATHIVNESEARWALRSANAMCSAAVQAGGSRGDHQHHLERRALADWSRIS
jgi:hypothetical protein